MRQLKVNDVVTFLRYETRCKGTVLKSSPSVVIVQYADSRGHNRVTWLHRQSVALCPDCGDSGTIATFDGRGPTVTCICQGQ